jgi:histidinol-phosphate aminotransferase
MSQGAHPGRLALAAIRGLTPYVPGKPAAELERELGIRPQDIAKLASNENPYGPSPGSLAAMRTALEQVWLYPDGASHELKAALSRHLGVDAACLTIGNGSNDLLMLLAEGFLTPQHSAVFSEHAFAVYALVTRQTGARGIEVAALARDSAMPLGHDLPAMCAAIDEHTRLVFIANPNNPTGSWASCAALRGLLARAPLSTLVVLDEAYLEYALERGLQDALGWLREYPNLVLLRTFSKAYALAGARVGYAISHPEVADVLNRVRPPFNVNSVGQAGALAALADPAHMRRAVAVTVSELRRVQSALSGLGIWSAPSAGNFLLVHVGAQVMPAFERLLRAGLIVRPLIGYRLPEYLRISIGTPEQNDRLLRELPAAIA